jgi:hypothetical protein
MKIPYYETKGKAGFQEKAYIMISTTKEAECGIS